MDFMDLKSAVWRQFTEKMQGKPLFRTTAEPDTLWQRYLSAFPPGADPIFRKRTEHDCSCCRQFIRTIGAAVVIEDGKLVSIWDGEPTALDYRTVARAMGDFVRSHPIANRLLHTQAQVGTDRNFEQAPDHPIAWDHFALRLPNSLVMAGDKIGPALAEARATHDVFFRGLKELTPDAFQTVLDLIQNNSLYRGEEHRGALQAFQQAMKFFWDEPEAQQDNWVWFQSSELPLAITRLRNTAIGTLLVDLSADEDIEVAVRKYETKVAPENYRRPTALVTPRMIENARATVEQLGLTQALERRHARLTDISINNLLFADRSARRIMGANVFDDLAATVKAPASVADKASDIPIADFLTSVLPGAQAVEMLVEARHTPNFVSLIAPEYEPSPLLFKWGNRFSWSYNGDVTDSIKERVKAAGGNVTGELCCRLAWSNFDDLDLHLVEPGGIETYYSNKGPSPCGARLDVDMNAGGPRSREPVENIFFETTQRMKEGLYRLAVHQFRQRESKDVGFEAQIAFGGDTWTYSYDQIVRGLVEVAVFNYTRGGGIEFVRSLPTTSKRSRKVWGIDTETFAKVNVIMLSPNHWDGGGIGNRHWFFMLEGCQHETTPRGFYNEFLRSDLDQHRKVLEMVGARMRPDQSHNQLSGVGFSSTQRNHAVVRVTTTSGRRAYRLAF